MNAFFNRWQRLYIGRMLIFLLAVATIAVLYWALVMLAHAISFLQPVLIPLAIASVIAFLLEPLVRVLCARTRFSRTVVVLALLAFVVLSVAGAAVWIVPRAYQSGARMVRDLPAFMYKAEQRFFTLADNAQDRLAKLNRALPAPPTPAPLKAAPVGGGTPVLVASPGASPAAAPGTRFDQDDVREWLSGQLPKLGEQAPHLLQQAGAILFKTFGGFLGSVGILLNVIIIPIYIFFLLTEARNIAKRWADFLPLKDSQFKQEVVSTLGEIHGYLVAFFRGQLVVSSIDAVLIASALWMFVGLNFSVVIGLLVLVLTFVPYLGILLCYIPAVLIAVVQFGDWQHPLMVVAIMFGVQTLESTIIAPKIVGESTGLHPLTVIVSVFAWELILEGPIGALLAVPLTAACKVIMRRYVWERARVRSRILPAADVAAVLRAGDRDRFGDGEPDIQAVPDAVAHPHENAETPAKADTANPPQGKQD